MVHFYENAFEKAYQNLCPMAPTELLDVLSKAKDPMAHFRGDQANFSDLHQVSQTDLGHIDTLRARLVRGQDVPAKLDRQLVGTISWLLKQIEIFDYNQSNSRVTLAAIFEVCARLSQISTFWVYVPRDKISSDFFQVMRNIFARIEHNISGSGAPTWERELMQSINEADTNERWSVLSKHWQSFIHLVHPHYLFSEASRFLYVLDLNGLIQIVDGMTTMWDILHAVNRLTVEEKIQLASLSQNARARFVLVQDALFHTPKNEALSERQAEHLKIVLTNVMACTKEWDEWMVAFNKYPVRAPQLQATLGRVLSNGDNAKLCSYINSISLYHHHDDCRLQVTECLKAFRDNASLEKRQELWKIAFDRWDEWKFGIPTEDVVLTQVAWSQIDFAVVGYFVEVLSAADLEVRRSEFSKVFWDMQFDWWDNIVDLIHDYHYEISKFALLPDTSASASDWSLPTNYRIPYDPNQDRYSDLTFNP